MKKVASSHEAAVNHCFSRTIQPVESGCTSSCWCQHSEVVAIISPLPLCHTFFAKKNICFLSPPSTLLWTHSKQRRLVDVKGELKLLSHVVFKSRPSVCPNLTLALNVLILFYFIFLGGGMRHPPRIIGLHLIKPAEFAVGWCCTFDREVTWMRYARSPRLNIASMQSASVSQDSHSNWMMTLFSLDSLKCCSPSLHRTSPEENADKAHLLYFLHQSCECTVRLGDSWASSYLFDKCSLLVRANKEKDLLFNICCKQEVSGGMQSPSPFSWCSPSSIVNHKHAFIHGV